VNHPASADSAAIARIAAGDAQAMKAFYEEHRRMVRGFAQRLVGDEVADDVTAEVFMAVWTGAGRFQGRARVSTWLLAITRDKAIQLLRRPHTEPLDDPVLEAIEDETDDPEEAMNKKQRRFVVNGCILKLSAHHRDVIARVYFEGASVADAARSAKVPPATMKTRVFYARQRLIDLLAGQGIRAH
jgi:RNA polymerase sigma-70 factor (ECF subfamily)